MTQKKRNSNAETLDAFSTLLGKAAEVINALNRGGNQPQDGVRQRISPPETSPKGIDPLQLLGLTPNATREEFNSRYKALMKVYHPDSGAGDDTMAKLINQAAMLIKERKGW